MEGVHTIQQLIRRNNLITKVDLSNFYFGTIASVGKGLHSARQYIWCGLSSGMSGPGYAGLLGSYLI